MLIDRHVTEAHRCEQLAQGCCATLHRVRFEPVDRKSNATARPLLCVVLYNGVWRETANQATAGLSKVNYC